MTMIEMRVGAIALDRQTGGSIVVLNDAENRRALPIWVGLPEARAISFAIQHVNTERPLTHQLFLSAVRQLGYKLRDIVINNTDGDTYTAVINLVPIKTIAETDRENDASATSKTGIPDQGKPNLLTGDKVEDQSDSTPGSGEADLPAPSGETGNIEALDSIVPTETPDISKTKASADIEDIAHAKTETSKGVDDIDEAKQRDIIVLDSRPSDAIALATLAGVPVYVAPQVVANASVPIDYERDKKEARDFKQFLQNVKASDFKLKGQPPVLPDENQ